MVSGDASGHSDAEITAVGGDYFFLFRDFKLASGSFFSEKDLMQTGAVIDSQLAWDLYGSDEVTGMNIYINNVKLYISGVIETPSTKPEEALRRQNSEGLYILLCGRTHLRAAEAAHDAA